MVHHSDRGSPYASDDHREALRRRAIATASIGDYIEMFYNPARRHPHLGYKSPIEFEVKGQISTFAA